MASQIRMKLLKARIGLLAGLVAAAAACALLLAPASAQETPQPSPEATTPAGPGGTVVRIQVVQPPEPIKSGEVFDATIMIDNVQDLAGFSFTVEYDADKLKPLEPSSGAPTPIGGTPVAGDENTASVQIDQQGAFLASSERGNGGDSLACSNPPTAKGIIKFVCNTLGPPLCLGGGAGASGSGILAVIPFESKGGGLTTINLTESTLASDNVTPCDPNDPNFQVIAIEHTRQSASVELAAKTSSNTTMIIVIVVVVLAVLGAGGAGGYWWYSQRKPGTGQ